MRMIRVIAEAYAATSINCWPTDRRAITITITTPARFTSQIFKRRFEQKKRLKKTYLCKREFLISQLYPSPPFDHF